MKHFVKIFLITALIFSLTACQAKNNKLSGSYIAVDPPVESGETVVMEVVFDGDQITMISGNISQQMDYQLADDQLILVTQFGSFSYKFLQEDDYIIIDGVTYEKS